MQYTMYMCLLRLYNICSLTHTVAVFVCVYISRCFTFLRRQPPFTNNHIVTGHN